MTRDEPLQTDDLWKAASPASEPEGAYFESVMLCYHISVILNPLTLNLLTGQASKSQYSVCD